MSANAATNMTAKPSSALNSRSVNASCVSVRPYTLCRIAGQMHIGQNGQAGGQLSRRRIENVILQLEERAGDEPREGRIQGDGHTAAHGRQELLHEARVDRPRE